LTLAVQYFQDSQLTKQIESDTNGDIIIDFIETPLGETNQREVWVKNMAGEPIQLLEPFVTDDRLKIIEAPTVLAFGGRGKIKLEFSDPKMALKSLNAKWGFKRVLVG